MDTKNLYKISEVAHACNVSRSTILRMEEKGLLTPYYVSADSGRRYYDNYDVAKINHIEHFKEMGLTTDEILAYYDSKGGEQAVLQRLEEKLYHFQRSVEEMRVRVRRTADITVQLIDMPAEVCCVRRGEGRTAEDVASVMFDFYTDCVKRGVNLARRPLFTVLESHAYVERNFERGRFPFQVCIPVMADKAPADVVEFPACKALTVVYYGGYHRNNEAWARLAKEIKERDLMPTDWPRSIGVVADYTGREIDRERWCTRIAVPVAPAVHE